MHKSLATLSFMEWLGPPSDEALRKMLTLDERIDVWSIRLLRANLQRHYSPDLSKAAMPLRKLLRIFQQARDHAPSAIAATRTRESHLQTALNEITAALCYELDRLEEAQQLSRRRRGIHRSTIDAEVRKHLQPHTRPPGRAVLEPYRELPAYLSEVREQGHTREEAIRYIAERVCDAWSQAMLSPTEFRNLWGPRVGVRTGRAKRIEVLTVRFHEASLERR